MSDSQKEKHAKFSALHFPMQNKKRPDFPIKEEPQNDERNPKFPFKNWQHYIDPGVEVKKPRRIGFIAQQSLCETHSPPDDLKSPDLPTSHPWFSCSSPPKH
jgi:hypothetical protein